MHQDLNQRAVFVWIVTKCFSGVHQLPAENPIPIDVELPHAPDNEDIVTPFTEIGVMNRLLKTSNSAPGKDDIRYSAMKKLDLGCIVMTALFNKVLSLKDIPDSWRSASIILIHKKGARDERNNWRPISLCSCLYKLFTSCLSMRISRWATSNNIIYPTQKGFGQFEGCYEYNFTLQSILDTTRRRRKRCAVAWLDSENAFSSVPHRHILDSLEVLGLNRTALNLLKNIYETSTPTIKTAQGESRPFPIRAGVRQGCPLSPIIFNNALEPVLRAAITTNRGFKIGDHDITVLAYADDLVLAANAPEDLQNILNRVGETAAYCGLTFRPEKCASPTLDCRHRNICHMVEYRIQGNQFPALAEGQAYAHFGIPTGYHVDQSPEDTIDRMTFERLDISLLAPWQKIDALSTFILPKISFILRGCRVQKNPLIVLDEKVKKAWINLSQRASPELLYVPMKEGGAGVLYQYRIIVYGVLPMADPVEVASIVQAYKILTCPESLVHDTATSQL
ncbi:hypothetical protein JTB14_019323 [Gonioctena quinquepunctata]|nr:hypothetical protein JTB14_019323 [Gonioctena quinquepunctata]